MRKILVLAPALLLAGCHSAQVVTRPAAPVAAPLAAAAPAASFDSALTATVTITLPVTPAGQVATTVTPAATQPQAQKAPLLVQKARTLAPLATAKLAAPLAKQLAHKLQRQRPTEGAAENGLGRVALFFIGVVLAVLAGLAALVSLIPGVSFWGGLGLVAAGLVVVFLLYSLFSGGKKKK
jgi:small-conductance mechanosensitive channel